MDRFDAPAALLDRLAQRLGPKGYATDAPTIAPHLIPWRGAENGQTPFLAMPASTAEAADIVRLCAEAGVAITPQGGNTGLVGGQIPQGEILLSLKRMDKIRSIDPLDDSMTLEAGVILQNARAAADGANRLFPLLLGSQGSATIGGLISTNAGGVHVVRYGMMRDLVLGLEVVLADGTILPGLKSLRKDNTGYDLKQFFIGAEGTLGIVTAATLKLFPKPAEHVVAMAAVTSAEAALELMHQAKARTGSLAAFELMNRTSVNVAVAAGARDPFAIAPPFIVLLEFEAHEGAHLEETVENTLGDALEAGLIIDAAVARSEAQAAEYWRLRETIPGAHKPLGPQMNLDISVPVSAVPRFLKEADAAAEKFCHGVRIVAFGHAGDGNIHYTMIAPEGASAPFPAEALKTAVQDIAYGMNGSISAEHGVGTSRRAELANYKPAEALSLMATVKAALDPHRIMNPRAMT